MTRGSTIELRLNTIDEAINAIGRGEMVVVMDDKHRENEGDLIMAAEWATPAAMAFMVRHTTGIVCVAMDEARIDALELPPMVQDGTDRHGTAFTVSVDFRHGTTTGVSAADRTRTIRALADPASTADDFLRPGHLFPLRARRGGVLTRAGHTEAAVDLALLAGCRPAGVLCEIVNDDGSMARLPDLLRFSHIHGLKIITVADLIRYRLHHAAGEVANDGPVAALYRRAG
jgi:3,4-dihydroxy 2-butanone 4-phosphate synthase/GTP cyclohydrolase II